MSVSMVELEDRWSFDTLTMANDVLDALEDAEARAMEIAKETSGG